MTTLLVAFDGRDDLSTDDLRRYYREEHAPLVADLPELEAYEVTFPKDPDRAPWDGIARLQFPDRAAFRTAMASDAAAAMEADAEHFVAEGSLHQLVGETESLLE
ncbi:MAG: EthD family reductase [Halobacteriaceae archaeon]